ncbi:helix-turn-helix transcriptional regulator [Coralliovum pocilloporae]|uniref:helix-turn-helix transcriptional regulator n=1 Tax=Coralliovum pocilloporae TaxID=3066369 RepID=UPI00330795F3
MSRSTRLFEIIQILRASAAPMTARQIADRLEVTERTVYRDMVVLQGMRVPIEGAAGIGYVMRSGFDLPPVNFDIEEVEAISVGLAMLSRSGDKGLIQAARRAADKLASVTELSQSLYSSRWGAEEPESIDMSEMRQAVREERKLALVYRDAQGVISERRVWPIAIAYHAEAIVIAAWCELRKDFRHFRPDRILSATLLPDTFPGQGNRLRQDWFKTYNDWL